MFKKKKPKLPEAPPFEREESLAIRSKVKPFTFDPFQHDVEPLSKENIIKTSQSELPELPSLSKENESKKLKNIGFEELELEKKYQPENINVDLKKVSNLQDFKEEKKGKEIFIKIENFKEVVSSIENITKRLEELERIFEKLKEDIEKEYSECDDWKNRIEDMKQEIRNITDKLSEI